MENFKLRVRCGSGIRMCEAHEAEMNLFIKISRLSFARSHLFFFIAIHYILPSRWFAGIKCVL